MRKILKLMKNELHLPIIVVLLAILVGIYHIFSYLIPFTDNAFVVTNISPVAADVSGFITDIHVKNGQAVKRNEPIFTVYQLPYQLAQQQASADYQEGLKKIIVLQKQIDKTNALIKSSEAELNKNKYELGLKQDQEVVEAVSKLEVKKLSYDVESVANKLNSLHQEVEVLKAEIAQQQLSWHRRKLIWI
jgi:multidrug resistance efflux pump